MIWPMRLLLLSSFAILATVGLNAPPARAACVLAGGTVTCTGADDDGFIGGGNLTVTVDATATVDSIYDGNPDTLCPVFRSALQLGQNARVTNKGQMLGRGNCGIGIEAQSGLTLINDGLIITDSEVAFGVLAGNAFSVTNNGRFRTVNAGSIAFVGASNGTFANASTGIIETTGADSAGIFAENGNTITNDGRITTANSGSFGIDVGANNTVTNTGTIITSGVASSGMNLRGAGNTVTNRGTISTLPAITPRDGEDSIGIRTDLGNNTITNSGTISGDYAGVLMSGADNRLNNTGTITARAPTAAASPGGAVVLEASSGEIINSGTIRGNGTAAIRTRADASLSLTNTGRIDGDIIMGSLNGAVTLGTGSVINGAIVGAANLGSSLNLTGSGTLSNAITNMGSLNQAADGAWTLARRYDVQFAILQAGTLTLTDGMRVGGTIFAQTRSRLTGIGPIQQIGGAVGGGNLSLSGTLAPGANVAGGVITIQGRATLNSGSRLEFDIAAGANDRVDVGGTIASGATLALTYAGTPVRDGQTFTLLTGANITTLNGQPCASVVQEGTAIGRDCFAITDNSPFFIRSSLAVTSRSVVARVQRQTYASAAVTTQEIAVASALDRAVSAGASSAGLLLTLDTSTQSEARSIFGALTTDAPAAAQTWGILAGGTVAASMSPWLEVAPVDSPHGQWRTWGSVFGRIGDSGPKTDSSNFDYDMRGVMAAADYAVVDGTRVGLAASHVDGETFFAVNAAKSNVSANTIGVYVSQASAQWRAGAGFSVSDGKLNTNRIQTIGAQTAPLAARADTGGESAFVQTSYALGTKKWLLKPTASLTYVRAKVGAYDESIGTGLAVTRSAASSLRGDVGLRAIAKPGPVHISLAAFWSQNFKDNDRMTTARLGGLAGSDFTIVGKSEKRGWLNTQAGVNIEVMPGMMARLGWSGILNDRLGGHTATAGLSYRW